MDSGLTEEEIEQLRRMTPAEKLQVVDELWRTTWILARAGVIMRNPHLSRDQIRDEARRLVTRPEP